MDREISVVSVLDSSSTRPPAPPNLPIKPTSQTRQNETMPHPATPTTLQQSLSILRTSLLPKAIHPPPSLRRSFTLASSLSAKQLPPRLKIDDADLTVSYLKGTGPGGQKIVRFLHHYSPIIPPMMPSPLADKPNRTKPTPPSSSSTNPPA